LPEGLYALIRQCLQKDAEDRPRDAHAALETLETVGADADSVAMPNSSLPGPSGAPAGRSAEVETEEPSSSELFGKTSDTSDHIEVRRRSEPRGADPEPTGDPTEELSGVSSADSTATPTGGASFSWTDPATLVTLVSSAIVVGGVAFWLAPTWSSDRADDEPDPHKA
ncbi:MAG: hypothetical protein ABEN55_16725, partial [Bradymonadaceae bacterium]